MSSFYLGDQNSRIKRKNICLRVRSLPEELINSIINSGEMDENDCIDLVRIVALRPNEMVQLEIWCSNIDDRLKKRHRSIVFYMTVKENLEWICEGDFGRGL